MSRMTWEDAVSWLRNQPDQAALVRACYFDDPLLEAAERFRQSPEWQAVAAFLPHTLGTALDLGSGRGISSYALAKAGWTVTALEPDPSPLVGAGAIQSLANAAGLTINVATEYSENLPFPDHGFDLINARQVLHHARDLPRTCREIHRVLKPGGTFIATRDHVLSKTEDLQAFLDSHALHKFYGGEHAFLLADYTSALEAAGLHLTHIIAPFDSPINYAPMTDPQLFHHATKPVAKYLGRTATDLLFSPRTPWGSHAARRMARNLGRKDQSPGRLYSFVASKPA
jgi:SAM-dependent methyltransferase